MGTILTEEKWPELTLKIKYLSSLIQNFAHRISSQAVRQAKLYSTKQSARSVDNATHVAIVEPLLLRLTLPRELFHLNTKLMHHDEYVRMEVNPFMEGLVAWQM
jgi:hypothetical protein